MQGGIGEASSSCAAPAWRATQEPGQDMSHFPGDIIEAEETEGTVGNSSGTCRHVIFFFSTKHIFIMILGFQTSGLKIQGLGLGFFFKTKCTTSHFDHRQFPF